MKTQNAVVSLQDQAQKAMEAIREMGRHGSALVRVTADHAGRDILRPDQANAVEETLQRIARFRDLLDHLQDCTRRSAEKIKEHKTAHAQRNGGIIA